MHFIQKFPADIDEKTDFLKTRHHCHKAEKESQCVKVDISGVGGIRLYEEAGQGSQNQGDCQNSFPLEKRGYFLQHF